MTDPSNPYASLPPGGQAPTWQAPQYGHSQPGYDQAPYGYGQGAYGQAQYGYGQTPYGYGQAPYGYGQPVYGQPGYVAPYDSGYDGMRTQAIVAIVLSVLSWFLFHIFMSVPAMIWAIILAGKAEPGECCSPGDHHHGCSPAPHRDRDHRTLHALSALGTGRVTDARRVPAHSSPACPLSAQRRGLH